MTEMTLFDPIKPRARRTDPETSHMAAEMAGVTAGTNRAKALVYLYEFGPMTDFELAAHTKIAQTSIGKRRGELVALGLAERAPVNPRPAPSGAKAIVWRLTPAGERAAEKLR